MKIVIDTNVIISAILKDRKPEEVILFIMRHPDFQWVASNEIMAEYLEVLQRPKFNLSTPLLEKWRTVLLDDNPYAAIDACENYYHDEGQQSHQDPEIIQNRACA